MADNQSNDRTTGDWIHTSMKAAMSALPVVGSPAAEFFGFHVVAPASKRKDEWIRSFEERLVALESKIPGLVEALPSSDAFITALHATQVAMRSHQAEKLTALQNAVLNVAAGAAPDAGRQLTFLAWVDAFTPAHPSRFLKLALHRVLTNDEPQFGLECPAIASLPAAWLSSALLPERFPSCDSTDSVCGYTGAISWKS